MLQQNIRDGIAASPGLCSPDNVGYAQVLVRCYLKRGNATVTEASPLVRQWILLRTLCARHHGATIKELSAEMGVGEKTIRRDLEAFQTAGFPLTETIGQFGRKSYRIDPDKDQPGLAFAFDEAVALFGPWCDPHGALSRYLTDKNDLEIVRDEHSETLEGGLKYVLLQ